MWWLPMNPELREKIIITDTLPAHDTYTPFLLKGAPIRCMQWRKNSLIVQTLRRDALQIEVVVADLAQKAAFLTTNPAPLTAIITALTGNIGFILAGLGKTCISQNCFRLIHSGANLLHKVSFNTGLTAAMSVSIDPRLLCGRGAYLKPLDYFYWRMQEESDLSFQQMELPVPEAVIDCYQSLLACHYEDNNGDELPTEIERQLFEPYIDLLRQKRRQLYLHDGHVAEMEKLLPWIERHVENTIGLPELQRKTKLSDFTVRQLFRNLFDQTPQPYIKEQKLVYLHQLIENFPGNITDLLHKEGIQYDWVMSNFPKRFGQGTKDIRHWGRLVFPAQRRRTLYPA